MVLVVSALWLPPTSIDVRFLLLSAFTILVISRASIRIPRVNAYVTVSDTFIFLVLLLSAGLAGFLLAPTQRTFAGVLPYNTSLLGPFTSPEAACSHITNLHV